MSENIRRNEVIMDAQDFARLHGRYDHATCAYHFPRKLIDEICCRLEAPETPEEATARMIREERLKQIDAELRAKREAEEHPEFFKAP